MGERAGLCEADAGEFGGKELVGVGVAENIHFDFDPERFERGDQFAQHHAVPEAGEIRVTVRAGDQKTSRAFHRVAGLTPRER